MQTLTRTATLLLLLLIPASFAFAQDSSRSKEPAGSITGRVLIEGRAAAWDAEGRRKLRSEAETAGAVIELKPCQKTVDYLLRFSSTDSRKAD